MLSMPITSSPRSRSFIVTCEPIKPAVPVTRTFIDFPKSKTSVHGVARKGGFHVVDDGFWLAHRPDSAGAQLEKLLVADGQDDCVVDALLYFLDRSQIVLMFCFGSAHPWIVD